MTLREWMQKNRPEYVDDRCEGGVEGCPSDYFLGLDPDDGICMDDHCPVDDPSERCRICWGREMPEEPKQEKHEPLCEYLVSWNGRGFLRKVKGNSITVGPKLDSGDRVRVLEKVMERQTGLRSIVVTNFVLLREVPADE